MADEKAQFTEVLEIDIQVDKFTQNLNTMLDQFDKAMTALEARASKTNINPLAGVNAGASSADVAKAIASIEATMDKFIQHQNKIFADLTNTVIESMDEAADGSKKAGDKQVKDAKESADKRLKIAKDESDEEIKLAESRADRIKRVTDEILSSQAKQTPLGSLAKGEQAEILNNLLTAKKAGEFNAATNLSAPNAKFFDDYQQKLLEQQTTHSKVADAITEKDKRETDARLQAATNLGNALDKLSEKRQVNETKASDTVAKKDLEQTNARLQAASNLGATLDKLAQSKAEAEAKSHIKDIDAEAKEEQKRQEALRQEDLKGITARSQVSQNFSAFLEKLGIKNANDAKKSEEQKTSDVQKEASKREQILEQSSKAQARYYDQYFKGTGQTANEKGFSGPGGGPKDFVPPQANGVPPAIKQTREEIDKANESTKGFFGTLTRDIPGLIGNVIRFGIAWKAFNAIINGIVGVPKLIFSEFQEGLKYLEQIQDRTANIKETLLQNVIYSKDFAENIKLSAEAAAFATQQIQQTAARFALEPSKLEAAFKGFIQAGGLKLVNGDLERGVELSAKLISVLRSRGIQDTNQRRIVSEIYDLMSGQEKKASVLLSTLNLTVPAWEKLRKEAEKHHNVEQLIEAALDASTDRLKGAGERYDDLLHTVTLYKEQVLGAFAAPVFQSLIEILQKVKKFFEDNRDTIFQTAQAWGILLDRAIKGVKDLGSQNMEALIGAFRTVAGLALATAGAVAAMANSLGTAVKIADIKTSHFGFDAKSHEGEQAQIDAALAAHNATADSLRNTTQQSIDLLYARNGGSIAIINQQRDQELAAKKAAIEKEVAEEKITREQATKELADFQVQLDKKFQTQVTAEGQQVAKLKTQIADLNKQIEAKREEKSKVTSEADAVKYTKELTALYAERDKLQAEKASKEAPSPIGYVPKVTPAENLLPEYEKQFRDELDKTKLSYQQLRDVTTEAVSARTKSHKDAAVTINKSYADELSAVQKLIDKYKSLFDSSNAKPQQIREAKKGLDTTFTDLQIAADRAQTNAAKQAADEQVKIAQEKSASVLRIQKAQAQAELALAQQRASGGYITESQLADKRIDINKREHDLNIKALEDELKRTGKGTVERQQILDKWDEENQRYTNQYIVLTQERERALENEDRLARQLQLESANLHAQEVGQDVAFANRHAVSTAQEVANNKLLLNARREAIDLAIRNAEAELVLQKAKNGETDATRKLAQELDKLKLERRQVQLEQVSNAASGSQDKNFSQQAERKELQKQIDQAASDFADAQKALQDFRDSLKGQANITQDDAEKLKDMSEKVQETGDALAGLEDQIKKTKSNFGDQAISTLLGKDFQSNWDNATSVVGKFAAAAGGAVNLLDVVKGVIDNYEQGRKQGGVLGGVGNVLSQGPVSDLLSSIPIVGQFVKPLGAVFSFIGGLFTRTAKKIAEEVKAAMQDTLNSFNRGDFTLKDTIAKLEQERQDAITRLSGQKGGKDQLNQLLPQFDDQIATLKKQAKDIVDTFEKTFAQMELHSDDLARVLATWQDINKQVQDYIGAGGDANKAAKFLSDNLQKIRQDAVNTLNEGEQQAIQDAIQLNDLLKQRVDLVKQFKQQEFDLINADAIERRVPGAVSRGSQLADLRAQNAQQLKDLDEQISLATQKVDKERQVFNIATDIDALHRQDDALTLAALDLQIQKWRDIQEIVSGITQGSNGLFGIPAGSLLGNALGITVPTVAPPRTPTGIVPRKPLGEDDPRIFGRQFRFNSFGDGGVVDKEQLAHIAEGDKPEAVVPLPNGRHIPVEFNWGALIKAITSTQPVQPRIDLSALGNIPRGISTAIGAIQITVHGNTENPKQLANTIADELARRARYGYKG